MTDFRKLLAAAVPGEWWVGDGDQIYSVEKDWIADVQPYDGNNTAHEPALSNAALIVAAVNALPGHLDEIERLTAEVGRLQKRCTRLSEILRRTM